MGHVRNWLVGALLVCLVSAAVGRQVTEKDFYWIVVCEAIMTFITAFGIGANDVANAFSTSVGSKSLTLRQACLIAAVMEFLGAFLMGSHVTDTVRKKIVDVKLYKDFPEMLMVGFFCADIATGLWLLLATYFQFPVSTTHSVIGAIVGFGIATLGSEAVLWDKVGMVVLSWVAAPLSAAVCSAITFFVVRATILRSEHSYARALKFYPALICLTLWTNVFFSMYKGMPQLNKVIEDAIPAYIGVFVALGIALVITIPVALISIPLIRKRVDKQVEEESAQAAEAVKVEPKGVEIHDVEKAEHKPESKGEEGSKLQFLTHDVHGEGYAGRLGEKAYQIALNAEKFDVKTEKTFNFIQVVTACFDSFAHGANDVANAIGTLAGCVGVYHNGFESKSDVPLWILALGGAGISIGLMVWGYKIIATMGVQLCHITPSRGFCIEWASATTVITCSLIGVPVSTTHCQVGSTLGTGTVDGSWRGVNWLLMAKIFGGWVFTLVFAGAVSAALTGMVVWSPSRVYDNTYNMYVNTSAYKVVPCTQVDMTKQCL